jgi:hypothetical protein
MYSLRGSTERQKRKSESPTEEGGGKRSRASLSPVSVVNPNVPESLLLYFRSRCDDIEAWKQLQENAENDEVAKAFVCDVLIHNDPFQRVSKDIERAQRLSQDIHYWIAATDTENHPSTQATKKYIAGICLAQGIGIPASQARAAQCIEEAAGLGHCLAQYYM